ncbi:MAG: ROK family protein [Anaerolineae bacterium]|nr:ROK family protein [Anaerolineae bacterium]
MEKIKNTQPNYVLAFDFGGTKLAAALVDLTSGEIAASETQATPANRGAEASLKVMLQAGADVLEKAGFTNKDISGVGISFGGPMSHDRRHVLRSLHVSDWDDFPLPDYVSKTFNVPAFMDNDGNAAALGEWYYGAGRGMTDMLYVQVSTGVGAGLILDRRVFRGQGLAAEFGHLTVTADGPMCACGKRGCVESLAAGWAMARSGKEAYAKAPAGSVLKTLGDQAAGAVDAKMLIEADRKGDAQAVEIVKSGFTYLGISVANAIALIDPQMVVIGGGLTRSWDVMNPLVQAALAEYLPPMFRNRTRVEHSQLHGTETLLGAALLTQGY